MDEIENLKNQVTECERRIELKMGGAEKLMKKAHQLQQFVVKTREEIIRRLENE